MTTSPSLALERPPCRFGQRHDASTPDTRENQAAYPQSSSPDLPLVGLVALISLATGVERDLARGSYQGKETGETALFRQLQGGLEPGEIVLRDRCSCTFCGILGLSQDDVDILFRMHRRRKFDFRKGRCPGVEDHAVTCSRPERPEWMDEEAYAQVLEELTVRELQVRVHGPGFRVNELVLVATMVDSAMYTKEDVAGPYLKRWNIELYFLSIKDVMQMDISRCKMPEMVGKEIGMHLLACNLIRGVMADAAIAQGKTPRQLSFKGVLQTMAAFRGALRRASASERKHLMAAMLQTIASHEVGDRPTQRAHADKRLRGAATSGAQTLEGSGLREIQVPFASVSGPAS